MLILPPSFVIELEHPWFGAFVLAASTAAFVRVLPSSGFRARHVPRAILALVVVALATGPRVRDPDPPRTRIFVVDRSRSFARARASIQAALEGGTRDLDPARDRICAIAFGAVPVLACDLAPASEARRLASAALAASVDPVGSDLGAALDLAREKALEAGGACEVVLLSDGRDTGGRTREAAALLGASSIPVHVVAPSVPAPPNARLARISVPRRAALSEPVRVEVEAETTVRSRVRLVLEAQGAKVLGKPEVEGSCEPSSPLLASFRVVADSPGVVRIVARAKLLDADDELPEDDALEDAFLAGESSRAVLVRGRGDGGRVWRELLEDLRFRVEERAPGELASLGNPAPDLVVLDDVNASALEKDAVPALGRLVESGSALVVAGDENAFGPGGYPGSPVDELLPVRSGPPSEQGKPLALELVIDASGSMGTITASHASRYVASIEAAIPRGRELRPGDLVGVVLFASEAKVRRPLSMLEQPAALIADLAQVDPRGGTDVAKGLVLGLNELASREARRLLILVTDGEDPTAFTQLDSVRAAAAAAAKGGELQVALVLVGEEPGRATLEALAGAVGPKLARVFTVADSGPELAKLVKGELLPESRHELRTGSFPVFVAGGGLEPAALPRISTYAPVRPRELAETHLAVEDSEREGRAALAVSRDRVLALATSLDRGGSALAAPGARGTLLALLRKVTRSRTEDLDLVATRSRGSVRIVATQRSVDPTRGDLVVSATEKGAEVGAPLLPVAPGKLEATLPSRERDGFLVTARAGSGGAPLAAAFVPPEASLELAPPLRGTDVLSEIARVSGSDRDLAPELGSPPPPRLTLPAKRPLAGELALAALALLVLEGALSVALERIAARRAARGLAGY